MRGELADRQSFPGGLDTGADTGFTHTFATEVGWGGRRHRGGPLTIHLSTGDATYERIAWTDQRGCCASIGLTPDGDSFQGG